MAHPARPEATSADATVLGVVLLTIGGGWLAQATGLVELTWPTLLSAGLIALGGALVFTARRSTSAMVVVAGVVMAAILAATTSTLRLDAGVLRAGAGDRRYTPASVSELDRDFATAAGQLTLDLTAVEGLPDLDGERRVDAKVGFGELRVIVPAEVAVRVDATMAAGEITVFGKTVDGVGARRRFTDVGYAAAPTRLALHLSGVAGTIEVVRGP